MLLSSLIDALYERTLALGRNKFWFLFIGLVFLTIIIINGTGIVPEAPYQRLSENLFITRTDIHFRNNFQETLLLPLVAHYIKATSSLTFNILCFVIITIGYAVFSWLSFKRWGAPNTLIFTTLLIASPLTTILLVWLGMPDSLTVVITIPFLFTNSAPLIFLLTSLGTANHVTFLIAAGEILVLRWISHSTAGSKQFVAFGLGTLAGNALLKAFWAIYHIEIAPRSGFILTRSLWEWAKFNMANFPLSIFSLFNIQWLALIICFVMFYRMDKRFYLSTAALLVANYAITFFSLDTTRIFSLISWGIFMMCIFHSYKLSQTHPLAAEELQKQFMQALVVIGLISIIAPRYFSWAGDIHPTPFYESIRHLLR